LGHHDTTRFFNSPALDRVLQAKDDPFGGPWSAAMDVGGWLRNLGLGQYEALFRASDIDADFLPELTEVDLEKLGVSLGLSIGCCDSPSYCHARERAPGLRDRRSVAIETRGRGGRLGACCP
jgi:hypothetical protein